MKCSPSSVVRSALCVTGLFLVACSPPAGPSGPSEAEIQALRQADEAQRVLEDTQAAYDQQAAEVAARGAELERQLRVLEEESRQRKDAETLAKIEAIRLENENLRLDGERARLESQRIQQEVAALQARPPVVHQQVTVVPEWEGMFRERLQPMGTWINVGGYGDCWRPRVTVQQGWSPYVDGRWAWSDQGWSWVSNEPFGWATYHYGRWVRVARHGWVWVPGTEWAPAWVSWRRGDEYVGWAPLPPEPVGHHLSVVDRDCDRRYRIEPARYVFVPVTRFVSPTYLNVHVAPARVTQIFNTTINVTKIVQITPPHHDSGHDGHAAFGQAGGPDREWIHRQNPAPVPVTQSLMASGSEVKATLLPPVSNEGRWDSSGELKRPETGVDMPSSGEVDLSRSDRRPGGGQIEQTMPAVDAPVVETAGPSRQAVVTEAGERLATEWTPGGRGGLRESSIQPISAGDAGEAVMQKDAETPIAAADTVITMPAAESLGEGASLVTDPAMVDRGELVPTMGPIKTETALAEGAGEADEKAKQQAMEAERAAQAAMTEEQARQQAMGAERAAQDAAQAAIMEEQTRQQAMEAERAAQEAAQAAIMEEQARQQAMEAERAAQEAAQRAMIEEQARQQAMEAERAAQEAAQAAMMEERVRQQQMEAERAAQEAAKVAMMEEQARQQAMEAERAAQEAAQRAMMEEQARQQQMEAQRAAQEAAQRAAEEAARQAAGQ